MPTTIPEELLELPQSNWRDKLLKLWMETRLGHEGMMLGKIKSQNSRVNQLADLALTGKVGETVPDDEDGNVSIGNEIHYHYQGGTETTTQPAPAGTQAASSTLGTVGKVALATALLGGGAGAGVAVSEYLRGDQPAASVDTDTDNVSDVAFPR